MSTSDIYDRWIPRAAARPPLPPSTTHYMDATLQHGAKVHAVCHLSPLLTARSHFATLYIDVPTVEERSPGTLLQLSFTPFNILFINFKSCLKGRWHPDIFYIVRRRSSQETLQFWKACQLSVHCRKWVMTCAVWQKLHVNPDLPSAFSTARSRISVRRSAVHVWLCFLWLEMCTVALCI